MTWRFTWRFDDLAVRNSSIPAALDHSQKPEDLNGRSEGKFPPDGRYFVERPTSAVQFAGNLIKPSCR
jgi:hypothetical protein